MSKDFLEFLYKKDRSYKILETCHTSQFDFNKKIYMPDAFWFCSDYHLKLSKNIKSVCTNPFSTSPKIGALK